MVTEAKSIIVKKKENLCQNPSLANGRMGWGYCGPSVDGLFVINEVHAIIKKGGIYSSKIFETT